MYVLQMFAKGGKHMADVQAFRRQKGLQRMAYNLYGTFSLGRKLSGSLSGGLAFAVITTGSWLQLVMTGSCWASNEASSKWDEQSICEATGACTGSVADVAAGAVNAADGVASGSSVWTAEVPCAGTTWLGRVLTGAIGSGLQEVEMNLLSAAAAGLVLTLSLRNEDCCLNETSCAA